jgi:hypothetical protein
MFSCVIAGLTRNPLNAQGTIYCAGCGYRLTYGGAYYHSENFANFAVKFFIANLHKNKT